MSKYNERPLYLLLDPSLSSSSHELPVMMFDQTIHVINDSTSTEFTRCQITIVADEAERITSYHCAKISQKAENESEIIPHYSTLTKAVTSLHQRLTILLMFLQDSQSGKIPLDHSILREIKGLCARLPVADTNQFNSAWLSKFNDSLLLTHLALLTQNLEQVMELNDKFISIKQNNGERERGGGGGAARRRHGNMLMSMMGLE